MYFIYTRMLIEVLEVFHFFLIFIKLKKFLFIYFYTEGKGGRKRGRETSAASPTALNGDATDNPAMGPDWGSNGRPFALCNDAQPTEPHRSGCLKYFNIFLHLYLYHHIY